MGIERSVRGVRTQRTVARLFTLRTLGFKIVLCREAHQCMTYPPRQQATDCGWRTQCTRQLTSRSSGDEGKRMQPELHRNHLRVEGLPDSQFDWVEIVHSTVPSQKYDWWREGPWVLGLLQDL